MEIDYNKLFNNLSYIFFVILFLSYAITPFYTADEYECTFLKCEFVKYSNMGFCVPIITPDHSNVTPLLNESFINELGDNTTNGKHRSTS